MSTQPTQPIPTIIPGSSPPYIKGKRWVSLAIAARIFDKSQQHMRRLCLNGSLIEFGIRIYCDSAGRYGPRGKYWVQLDDNFRPPEDAKQLLDLLAIT